MRRLSTWAAAAVLPALLSSLLMIGCSGGSGAPKDRASSDTGMDAKTTGSNALEALAATGSGTLEGRVTLDGLEPDLAAEATYIQGKMKGNALHGDFCLSGPKDQSDQQRWRIGQNKGVGNVFVWLQPPAGKYFKVDLSKENWPAEVIIDQPHCALRPHAAVLFRSAYNGDNPKGPISTGQKLIVKNTAPMNHNDARLHDQGEVTVAPTASAASGHRFRAARRTCVTGATYQRGPPIGVGIHLPA